MPADPKQLKGIFLAAVEKATAGDEANGTRIADLSPLKGMKLKVLGVNYTRVTDLAPLGGMPLQVLWLLETPLTDPAPLQGMPLKEIACDFQPGRDAKILRSLTGLEKINFKPAAEFWKEVDGK
jgi:hypothetical protein